MYGEFDDVAPLRANITPEDVGKTARLPRLGPVERGDRRDIYVDGGFNILGVPTGE